MLNRLLTRQRVTFPNGNSVDGYGRISRNYLDTWAGTFVDRWTALSVPGVWRGVNLIASAIEGLPIDAIRNDVVIDTPPILSRPNPPETRFTTIQAAVAAAIIEFITGTLIDRPRVVGKPLNEPLQGIWAARRGAYRVLYRIDEPRRTVLVIRIDHRSDAYRP